jgi:hypothetical protein
MADISLKGVDSL